MMTSETLSISNEHEQIRLDRLLTSHFPAYSRTYFQELIDLGLVLVNGERWKKKDLPRPGDTVEICFQLRDELSVEPEAIALDILYEDPFLIAVNKPAGMVVHPAPGHPRHTFANALLHHCKTLPHEGTLRPGIVHRLDKETSGVLLAAKTTEAHQKLVALFAERKIEKTYLAIAVGNPGSAEIRAPIGRHPLRRKEMTIRPEGKEAVSDVTVVKTWDGLSLLSIRLITGRTHQIRVHLKSRGTPVLGDAVYGSPSANDRHGALRQMLHAHTIKLTHPMTGESLSLEAPLPADFQELIM
jgi:23S rRNA pseudouridine1911/1915/1917 synthase